MQKMNVKALFGALLMLLLAVTAWAEEVRLDEQTFTRWCKTLKISGALLDEKSFKNFDNVLYSAEFVSPGSPTHHTIRITEMGNASYIRGNSNLEEFVETTINGNKAFFCTLKTMPDTSTVYMELPLIAGELELSLSPRKSLEEMKAILNGIDTLGLNGLPVKGQ